MEKTQLLDHIKQILERPDLTMTTALIGKESGVSSMDLVRLCLSLEDYAETIGFSFDWTSDSAFSESRSFFRTPESLIDAFLTQKTMGGK